MTFLAHAHHHVIIQAIETLQTEKVKGWPVKLTDFPPQKVRATLYLPTVLPPPNTAQLLLPVVCCASRCAVLRRRVYSRLALCVGVCTVPSVYATSAL
jgi:hypothetical protein